jgi:hypothetical protein
LKAFSIKSVPYRYALPVHAQMVFRFLGCLMKEKNYRKVCSCFFENTYGTNFNDCSEVRIRISDPALVDWLIFSSK